MVAGSGHVVSLGGWRIQARPVAAAVALFGTPRLEERDSFDCLARWNSIGLVVELINDGTGGACRGPGAHFGRAILTGSRWRTDRGLAVGNSVSRVQSLYPGATLHGTVWWLFPRDAALGISYSDAPLFARTAAGRVTALGVEAGHD